MKRKKKYPRIQPWFIKDKNGKILEVVLKTAVYESILQEMGELEKRIATLKKKSAK